VADPLLIPAYPQVLAPGLRVLLGGVPHVVTWVGVGHGPKLLSVEAVNIDPESDDLGTETGPLPRHATHLDLRVPAVRDAVLRAIHAELLGEHDEGPLHDVRRIGDLPRLGTP